MLFDRPLASFTNNIIYIDHSNNRKIKLEVVCKIFCFLKITSFHTPYNNFKTLPLPSKLWGEKWQERLWDTRSIVVFRRIFLVFFFSWFFGGIPAVSQNRLSLTITSKVEILNLVISFHFYVWSMSKQRCFCIREAVIYMAGDWNLLKCLTTLTWSRQSHFNTKVNKTIYHY